MIPIALTIASSDSSNGAGVTADLRVFEKFGVYGTCVITNVTAQNSGGVKKIYKIAPRITEAQIDAVIKDFPVKAAKIGMLYSQETVNAVAKRIKRRNIPNVILDIPLVSKNSLAITKESAYRSVVKNLLPLCLLVTPNRDEAEKLACMEINTDDDIKTACRKIYDLGVKNVLLKGGHFDSPSDVFFDGRDFYVFSGEKYRDKNVHGTGCTLSAAICACVAKGMSLGDSIEKAKEFLNKEITKSEKIGRENMDFFVPDIN